MQPRITFRIVWFVFLTTSLVHTAAYGGATHYNSTGQFTLSWQPPPQRENGTPFAADDAQAYVLFAFGMEDIEPFRMWLEQRIVPEQRFYLLGEQLAPFISAADIEQLTLAGSPLITIVYPHENPYQVAGLSEDTYYVAVATVDWSGQFSKLSNTLKIVVDHDSAPKNPQVSISPPTGVYAGHGRFDLTLRINRNDTLINDGSIQVNGIDITAALEPCWTLDQEAGQAVYTCPDLDSRDFGGGATTLTINLQLSDGSSTRTEVVWTLPP